MDKGALGRVYQPGDLIIKKGEIGDCMYVIQQGKVEVYVDKGDKKITLAVLDEGDFFGEMAIFDREVRSATVQAIDQVRALTVDKKNFLRRISSDPSLAFRIVETMSRRIREMQDQLSSG